MPNPEPREWPAHRDFRKLAAEALSRAPDLDDPGLGDRLADAITAAVCERIAMGLETEPCICSLDSPHGRYAPSDMAGGRIRWVLVEHGVSCPHRFAARIRAGEWTREGT